MSVTAPTTRTLTFREAIRDALADALRRDPRVFLVGEDVGRYGGCYAVSKGLLAEFGPERIRDAPLSETGFTGAGIGAAINGMRPIVEIMTINFSLLAMDQIVHNASMLRYMSGGQVGVPLVIRMPTGAGRQLGAQHSNSLEGWYAAVPGLKVLVPGTIEDARGMLWPALQDPDPVLIFEHVELYGVSGALPDPAPEVDPWRAIVRRPGDDVTLVAWGNNLRKALAAADVLAKDGVSAEVVDVRALRPLDLGPIAASVGKTRRAVVVDEAWRSGGMSAEVAARLGEEVFWSLDAPIARVGTDEVPIPYPAHLEEAVLPQVPDIVAAARGVLLG